MTDAHAPSSQADGHADPFPTLTEIRRALEIAADVRLRAAAKADALRLFADRSDDEVALASLAISLYESRIIALGMQRLKVQDTIAKI